MKLQKRLTEIICSLLILKKLLGTGQFETIGRGLQDGQLQVDYKWQPLVQHGKYGIHFLQVWPKFKMFSTTATSRHVSHNQSP